MMKICDKKCSRCQAESEKKLCVKCKNFLYRFPIAKVYKGEIRAGDTFVGQEGFVWARDGEMISLYCINKKNEVTINKLHILEFRARALGRQENETGQVLWKKEN